MRMQVDGADDRRIGQMLIGLRRGRLPPVSFPVRLVTFLRRDGGACEEYPQHRENRSPHASYYVPVERVEADLQVRLVDLRAHASHNRFVLRRLFFAAMLCVLAWATANQKVACRSEGVAAAASSNPCPSATGGSTDSADHQWNARHPTSASAHESVWRSPLHHSELAGVHCPDLVVAIPSDDAPDHRSSFSPVHLRRIPLLI